jgi:hypothetical protein
MWVSDTTFRSVACIASGNSPGFFWKPELTNANIEIVVRSVLFYWGLPDGEAGSMVQTLALDAFLPCHDELKSGTEQTLFHFSTACPDACVNRISYARDSIVTIPVTTSVAESVAHGYSADFIKTRHFGPGIYKASAST